MKKLIVGICLASSFTTFAQTQEVKSLVIKNLTYPNQSVEVKCEDSKCELLTAKFADKENLIRIHISDLNSIIKDRGRYEPNEFNSAFELTRNHSKIINKNVKEAYYGKAIGNSVLTVGTVAADILTLPLVGLSNLFVGHRYTVAEKKGAKRLKLNLLSEQKEMIVKHKYYKQITDVLENAGNEYDLEFDQTIYSEASSDVKDMMDGKYSNCRVLTMKAYSTNYIQLYVNNEWSKNYYSWTMDSVENKVAEMINNNTCILK